MKSIVSFSVTAIILLIGGCNFKKNKPTAVYSDYDRATYLHYYKKYDSAFLMYNQYINKAGDTLKKGMAYLYMGDLHWMARDLHGAEESLGNAIRTFDSNDTTHHDGICKTYRLLGVVWHDMKRYNEAIEMYNKAIGFNRDPTYLPEILNSKALSFQYKKEYDSAINIYNSILQQNNRNGENAARAIDNSAKTKWLQNSDYPALPEYWHALQIRLDSQYSWGINASYAHLSDYYEKINPDSALWYANKRYQQAQLLESADDRIEAIDQLIAVDNTGSLKSWYTELKRLSDSLQLARDTSSQRFAIIKYDFKKSNTDNTLLKKRVTQQRFGLFALIALTFLIVFGIDYLYKKRKKRLQLAAENTIRDASLKTSQKVHDVVANGLYGIMNELEHGKNIEREPLITKIEDLYEKSRNISYEQVPTPATATFSSQVRVLLTSFASDQTKVILVGNQELFWNKINEVQKQQLLLVLQELMINMKKHSAAKNVVLLFSEEQHKALVTYKDDGKGFEPGQQNGNGLNNTVNRIYLMKGDIIFGKSEKGGAAISISLPLEPTKI